MNFGKPDKKIRGGSEGRQGCGIAKAAPTPKAALPTKRQDRKDIPLYWGLVNYFRDALIGVAKLSMIGNEQHNPGQPLHWAREKGGDELDAQMRHIFELHGIDIDLVPHSVKNAWRALAVCQLDLEENPWTTSVADTIKLMRQQADPLNQNACTCTGAPHDPDCGVFAATADSEQWVVIETLTVEGSVAGNIRGYGPFSSKLAAMDYGRIVHRASAKMNFCSVMKVNDVKNIRPSR